MNGVAVNKRTRSVCASGAAAIMATATCAYAVACTTTSSTTTPITGITIRADSITQGHGCGVADAEVYKYAAVAWNIDYSDAAAGAVSDAGVYAFGNVFDCYADGFFPNLPSDPDGGGVDYTVVVGAFDKATYDNSVLAAAIPSVPADLETLIETTATYRYSCTATQEANVAVLAVCHPSP